MTCRSSGDNPEEGREFLIQIAEELANDFARDGRYSDYVEDLLRVHDAAYGSPEGEDDERK